MIDPTLKARAIALYDRFTHETHDRRAFMAELTKLAGGVAAANVLLASIAGDPAAAAIIAPDDKRLTAKDVSWPSGVGRTMAGYMVTPAGTAKPRGGVIVIHENRGLTPHIRDVARRIALEGYVALAPDFLTPSGGTSADENAARDAIGKLDPAATVADGVATVAWLKANPATNGKVAAMGFCWGGMMTNRIAVAAGSALAAAIPYYGPAPAPTEAAKVKAAMLLHYAGIDERVNQTAQPWIDALKAARVPSTAYFYEGANHAFNNDTSTERYNAAAAKLAWGRTSAFLKERLG